MIRVADSRYRKERSSLGRVELIGPNGSIVVIDRSPNHHWHNPKAVLVWDLERMAWSRDATWLMKQLNYHIKMHSFVTLTIHRTVVKISTGLIFEKPSGVFDICVSCFLHPQSALILECIRQGVLATRFGQSDAILELSIRGKHHSMMHTESEMN